jgi:hypothetical protein
MTQLFEFAFSVIEIVIEKAWGRKLRQSLLNGGSNA